MLTDIILTFVGVACVTYGLMSYISAIVRTLITKKTSFSLIDGLFCVGIISLGMSILLNI
jgi:hypothetical protein